MHANPSSNITLDILFLGEIPAYIPSRKSKTDEITKIRGTNLNNPKTPLKILVVHAYAGAEL